MLEFIVFFVNQMCRVNDCEAADHSGHRGSCSCCICKPLNHISFHKSLVPAPAVLCEAREKTCQWSLRNGWEGCKMENMLQVPWNGSSVRYPGRGIHLWMGISLNDAHIHGGLMQLQMCFPLTWIIGKSVGGESQHFGPWTGPAATPGSPSFYWRGSVCVCVCCSRQQVVFSRILSAYDDVMLCFNKQTHL